MPKKAPKNAFFYFMQDFREEQQKKGINYGNLAEVSKAADPEWRNAPPQVRARYEAKAKSQKEKRNIPVAKYTSTGIPLSIIEQEQKAVQEAIEFEIQDIINMVKTKKFNKSIYEDYFYLMDVNYFCKTPSHFVIAESTVLRFSLKDGFHDLYHEWINPGSIPVGYASDVKQGSIDLGIEMPDETAQKSNYMQILANIIDYLKQNDPSMKQLPPLYTMPEKVMAVQDFILQMCQKSGEDEFIFRVYKLDTLFFHLINNIKNRSNEGFPKESLALVQLTKDPFKYNTRLGCEKHGETNDKSVECTVARTKRWAFTIMDSCCPVVGIPLRPGKHVPPEFDVEGIEKYNESMKPRSGPTIAGVAGPSSSCNTTGNESLDEQSVSVVGSSLSEHVRKEQRTHAPLRMPQSDYSKNIRPAPELTEDDFPALGAGRGRGLAGSFGKMNIRK